MKARLNLTIDEALLHNIKAYATKQQTSVSELVENYFEAITKPAKRRTIIAMVDKLETPDIEAYTDLKELYYQEKAKKYGF